VLPSAVMFDGPGYTGTPSGEVERQGENGILLRPGAKATFTPPGLPRGPVEFELTQLELGRETEIVLGGIVSLNGVPLHSFTPSRSHPSREGLKAKLRATLTPILAGLRRASLIPAPPAPMPDRKLVETCRWWCDGGDIELALSAGEHHARLVRLRVRSHTTAAARAAE